MIESNRDMFPSTAMRSRFDDASALINNSIIDDAFNVYEQASNSAKRFYHGYGRLSVSLISISVIYTMSDALILSENLALQWGGIAAAVLGAAGIAVQVAIIATKQRDKWLLSRFAAERLRSLKFQAYHLATADKTNEEITALAAVFARRGVAKLDEELNAGISALKSFSPQKALETDWLQAPDAKPDIKPIAREAYSELRILYQQRYVDFEAQRISQRRRIFEFARDAIYLSAGGLGLISLSIKALGLAVAPSTLATIDWVSVSAFVVGASKAVVDNASLEEPSLTRLEQYTRDIQALSTSAAQDSNFIEQMRAMELLCLYELDSFCRAGLKISYRL